MVVGLFIGRSTGATLAAGIAMVVDSIKRSHIRANPNLDVMDSVQDTEEYVRKVAQAAIKSYGSTTLQHVVSAITFGVYDLCYGTDNML